MRDSSLHQLVILIKTKNIFLCVLYPLVGPSVDNPLSIAARARIRGIKANLNICGLKKIQRTISVIVGKKCCPSWYRDDVCHNSGKTRTSDATSSSPSGNR